MKITLVKKIKADGSPCRKCGNVLDKLDQSGLMKQIDQVVVADERDSSSEGMVLASKYNVETAPFFIVENDDGSTRVYTVYSRFLKEVLDRKVAESEEISEIMDQNPDLDFI